MAKAAEACKGVLIMCVSMIFEYAVCSTYIILPTRTLKIYIQWVLNSSRHVSMHVTSSSDGLCCITGGTAEASQLAIFWIHTYTVWKTTSL
jgi:hypothetical protein